MYNDSFILTFLLGSKSDRQQGNYIRFVKWLKIQVGSFRNHIFCKSTGYKFKRIIDYRFKRINLFKDYQKKKIEIPYFKKWTLCCIISVLEDLWVNTYQ